MTDTEITIALAGLEGWTLLWACPCRGPTVGEVEVVGKTPDGRVNVPVKAYLHDANAVLPLLEKWRDKDAVCRRLQIILLANPTQWLVFVEERENAESDWSEPRAFIDPSFCRAAAIAVLKAHGLWREAQAEEGKG